MPRSPSRRPSFMSDIPLEARLADEARFLWSWLDNPAIAGAVSPSGRFLARMMARYVDPLGEGPIIELGPGTGSITDGLLRRGVAPERLILVEFDAGFCRLLKRRFPGVRIIQGDAYRLRETVAEHLEGPAAAIVSSLPLLMKAEPQRLALLDDAFRCMTREGAFIQFTYGPVSPIPRPRGTEAAFDCEASPPVWLNLPPARVWVYRQKGVMAETGARPLRQATPVLDFLDRLRAETEKMHSGLQRELNGARARLQNRPKPGRPAGKSPPRETGSRSRGSHTHLR